MAITCLKPKQGTRFYWQRVSRVPTRAARDALIWEFYLRGYSMAEIAGKAECSVGTVHRIIVARRDS